MARLSAGVVVRLLTLALLFVVLATLSSRSTLHSSASSLTHSARLTFAAIRQKQLASTLWSWSPRPGSAATYPRSIDDHPIYELLEAAEATWQQALDDRTDSLQAARDAYELKYGIDPPQGYDDWWQAAEDNGYSFIDKHDLLFSKLAPFMTMPPEEIRRRTWQVGSAETFSLVQVTDGNVTVSQPMPSHHSKHGRNIKRAEGLAALLAPIAHLLPDMTFAVNELPEPRNIQPWSMSGDSLDWAPEDVLHFPTALLQGEESVWHLYRRTCPAGSPARGTEGWESGQKPHLPIEKLGRDDPVRTPQFLEGRFAMTHDEMCRHPDRHLRHSQFFDDYRPLDGLWPCFSVCTQDGFGDIPFPSDYYLDSGYAANYHLADDQGKDHEDAWSTKKNKIYWRGVTNPGYDKPTHHQQDFPRRRFLEMTATRPITEDWLDVAVLNDTSSFVQLVKLNSTALNEEIMDVAFTNVWNCGPQAECEAARHGNYRFANRDAIETVRKYKLLLDLDGLAYSARFAALLQSGGAVIKSTVYQEFFSEWIQPWKHYIPLSNDFHEIYSIFAFFLGVDGDGDQPHSHATPEETVARAGREALLQRVGRSGQDFAARHFRQTDLHMYTWRLALEWARLYRGADWVARSSDPFLEDGAPSDNVQVFRMQSRPRGKSAQTEPELFFAVNE